MEMERDCLATVYGNGKGLFGNRLWKWKWTVWATVYGNGKGLFGNHL
jgi:hypothetical protein